MDLLWMILPLFLVCTEAKNLTEVKVELGQDIILNCSEDISEMHWYMEIHSQLRGCIFRTFSPSGSDPQYCSPNFKTKFSVQRNSLVIKNITAEDCRRYFCAKKKNGSIVYVDTFRLVSDVSTTQSPQSTQSTTSCETTHQQERHKWTVWQDSRVMYTSFTLNAFLFLLVLGLISVLCLMKNGDPSPFTCENQETLVTVQRNSLVIKNITAGDCRRYFCAKKKNDSIVYVDTFCLVSDVSTTPSPQSTQSTQSTTSCEPNHQQERHKWTVWQDSHVMYASFTLNAFLFLLVIGLLCTFLCLKIKKRKLQASEPEPSPVLYDDVQTLEMPQYEEIQHSTGIPQPVPVHSECIYYKAQLPRSTQH